MCFLPSSTLSRYSSVVFDFDGVILDTLPLKASAFVSLFPDISPELSNKITTHHFLNGGISRFLKIPMYASWAGLSTLTKDDISKYSEQFSDYVLHFIKSAPPLPGIIEYIQLNSLSQKFFISSASSRSDLMVILSDIGILDSFCSVYGSPSSKNETLESLITSHEISASNSCFIGDSVSDYEVSRSFNIDFFCIISESMFPYSSWSTFHPRQTVFNGILP